MLLLEFLADFDTMVILLNIMFFYPYLWPACTKQSGRGAARRGALGRNFWLYLQNFMYGIFTFLFIYLFIFFLQTQR